MKQIEKSVTNIRTTTNYLIGVLIKENLSWKNYIDCVIAKLRKTIQMIA